MSEIIIIGGGAAGLMAAVTAAGAGAHVTLLERNEKLGKKIYITGKGRCNATNACEPDAFMKSVVKNPRFLYSALNVLPPSALMEWLENHGCPIVVERGDRVFPESQKASDVTRAFERELRRLNVNVRLNARVQSLDVKEAAVTGVTLENGQHLSADAVIVCTGGQSYVSTGSTGDGWKWHEQQGHTTFPALPSLVGLTSDERWVQELQGLSLKNVRLTLTRGKKKLYTELGEMLFTHFGVSGPLVLSASAYMTELAPEDVTMTLDLKPGLKADQLDARILRDVAEAPKKQLSNLLCGLYPSRLAETMIALCQLDGTKPAGSLTREERARLVQTTQALVIPISGTRSLNEAIVTRGGVSVKEIDPSTMESRLVKGLYVAGELLDVDALTGGFNLHIAFSTGFLAGRAAAQA
ncbi:MAG: NAD(P)/FAD-dependent oxidoreductase [Clostridia bacterium]|nr:NAD(P)/FAD-dependent oxidoreductase [Clostridia bacterium]